MCKIRIRELRVENNMTISQLADALGVCCSTLNKWEKSVTKPSINNAIKIAKFFNVRLNYLFGIDNIKKL